MVTQAHVSLENGIYVLQGEGSHRWRSPTLGFPNDAKSSFAITLICVINSADLHTHDFPKNVIDMCVSNNYAFDFWNL